MTLQRPKIVRRSGERQDGKGFSRGELRKAGTSLTEAVKLHLPVDPRRKTVHEENISAIKTILEKRASAAKEKPKRKSKS